jgi:glycosyltransferase involved in cell wall biosynthesis
LPSSARPGTGARILFINQYYWPDHASTAQHLADLAETLVEKGYACDVLCSRGGYQPGGPRRPTREVHRGVRIHRVGATALGRRTTLARMIDYLSFLVAALLRALTLPRYDVVITLTTPPMLGFLGTVLRRFKGARHISWLMDLHPDASVALGRMSPRNPFVAVLSWLSDALCRAADKVVVLGSYMADRVRAKRVRPHRLTTIPVWSRREEIRPAPREGNSLRWELGLEQAFVLMYSGNLGLAHDFDAFLEAAHRLRNRTDIAFVFAGDGPRMKEVREAKAKEDMVNVRVLDYVPREQLAASLGMADLHLISMRREMTGIVVPGKLYGIMAAGRPALFVGPEHCETADTIRHAECGLTFRQDDVDGVVEAIVTLAEDPAVARSMGERGRAAFLAEFERAGCCEQWAAVIDALVAPARTYGMKNKPRQVLEPVVLGRPSGDSSHEPVDRGRTRRSGIVGERRGRGGA